MRPNLWKTTTWANFVLKTTFGTDFVLGAFWTDFVLNALYRAGFVPYGVYLGCIDVSQIYFFRVSLFQCVALFHAGSLTSVLFRHGNI